MTYTTLKEELSVYNAVPNSSRARYLRTVVNERLKLSLAKSLQVAESIFPLQVEQARPILESLDEKRRISPLVFTLNWQLAFGIRSQDPATVTAALGRLTQAYNENRFYSTQLEIDTVCWDELDVEMMRYLVSPEVPRSKNGEIAQLLLVAPHDAQNLKLWAQEALELIRRYDPEMFGEVNILLSRVRFFNKGVGAGLSSPRSFGLAMLKAPLEQEPDRATMLIADNIAHETSHINLNAVMQLDKLVLNNPAERYASPLRPDARPMAGLYHAVFVLSRLGRLMVRMAANNDREMVNQHRDKTLNNFYGGYETVEQHGELTEAGQAVLHSCKELVDSELTR